MDTAVIYLVPIVFLAYATEAVTGFGAAVVAVTLGAHFYPIDELVPVLVLLNVWVTGYIAVRYRRDIAVPLLKKRVFPFMGIGIVLGLALFPLIRGLVLKELLGLFVVLFSGRELLLIVRTAQPRVGALSRAKSAVIQVFAGIMHALYTTGGPLLVYSLSRVNLPKGKFRATLCAVWAILNSFLILVFIVNGRINSDCLKSAAFLFPLLPLGILAGEWLHNRINEHYFRIFIFSLLLFSGGTLLF